MREILFRGKSKRNGWVYGDYWTNGVGSFFIRRVVGCKITCIEDIEVAHETVGQYTGLRDKTGKKIFEGDILQVADGERYFVDWSTDEAAWRRTTCGDGATPIEMGFDWFDASNGEVISNIHDNQELIGKAVKE